MVETITPAVHGGRTRRYWGSVTAHVVGATLTAGVFGVVLGALGALLRAPWPTMSAALLGAAAVVYALREAFRLSIPTFDRRRQVPEWWREFYSPVVSSLLFGAGLGIGFFTFLTYGTYVVVCVAAVVSGDPLVGALCCGAFGLARALSVVVAATETETSGEVVDRLDRFGASGVPRLVNAAALAMLAAAAMVSLA